MISPFFLFIFLLFLPSQAFYQNGSFIHDLQSTTTTYGSNTLSADAAAWSLSNSVCASCSKLFVFPTGLCGYTYTIFGGPNILGPAGASTFEQYYERQYQILNDLTWNYLALEFQAYVFTSTILTSGSYTSTYMAFKVNDVVVEPRNVGYSYCNPSYTDSSGIKVSQLMMINIQHLFPYFGTNDFNLKILIRFTNASTLQSLGFKDVKIRTLNTNVQGYSNFPCDINYYYNGTTCLPCHSYCSSCYGPTNDQCNSCIYPKYSYQNGSCYDTCPTSGPLGSSNYTWINYCWPKCTQGYYWAYNDSCSTTCDAPFKKTSGQNYVNYCSSPCTDSSQYLYPNGSCLLTCSSPFIPENLIGNNITVNLCLNPCKAADGTLSFLFPNGSCDAICPSPLSSKVEIGTKYCYTPCTGATEGYYLYPNRTCNAACNAPLVQYEEPNGGWKYCINSLTGNISCLSGITVIEFLFPNGSCTASCPSPLLSRYESSIKYCWTPCTGTQYLYPNRTCSAACSSPLVQFEEPNGGWKYCTNPCQTLNVTSGAYIIQFLLPNSSCTANCPSPLLSRTESSIKYCWTPCTGTQYLYSNGSCFGACNSPLVSFEEPNSGGFRYCTNPCKAADGTLTFLYPNGTCKNDCPSPLLSRTEPGVKYCFTPCDSLQYLYPNSSCSTCAAPLVPFIESNSGGFRYCTNPCKAADGTLSFLYPNRTCSADCPLPLLSRTEPDVKFCFTPCQMNEYLYPNGTCNVTCYSPLVVEEELTSGFKYCRNPCQSGSTSTFLYPNSTCHSDCLSPLLSRTETNIKYCYTPCQSNQYLYRNGSCSVECPLPLMRKVELNTFSFCINPCFYSSSLFLFPDGTCNSTCPLPLFNRTDPEGKYCENPCAANKTFLHEKLLICQETCPAPSIQKAGKYGDVCKFPCENPDHYYHTMEKQCKATCDFPREAQETPLPKLCISSLSEEEVKQVQQMANAASAAGTAADTGLMVFSVISSSDSTSACMGPLAKMLQYIRFMDIVFPEKVVLMLQEQAKNANKGGFTQKILGSSIDNFPNKKLKGKFYTYKTTSNFFVNFWPSLFNLLVILLVTMLLVGLTRFTKGHHPKIHEIFKGLTDVVKWNVFLITFCGSIGDIVLFTALEFQTMELNNSQAVFSFMLCLAINALAIFIVRKILHVNSDIRKSTKNTLGDEHKKLIEQKFSSYRALFECYKEYSYYQQIFLFVFILRLAIFNAAIGYLYNSPLFQAVLSVILNILMLGYLVLKRPMKKLMNLIQQIILELVLLPFNLCVLTLAIMDHKEIVEIDRRKAIGEVIFYINLMIPMLSLALMAAKFIVMGFELYKTWKMEKAKKAKGKGKQHKGIELSRATQVTTEEKISNQQNLIFETSQCKILSDNTQILDLTDNNSIMSNSRLSSPVFPKMKIKRTRRFGDHQQQNSFTLENNNHHNGQINNSNFYLENSFYMENNLQNSSYYLQPQQVQQNQQPLSSTIIQQEEFEGQEVYENQEITMTQSEIIDGNLTREQDIPYESYQQNFAFEEENKNNFKAQKNFQMENNFQPNNYLSPYPQQQMSQQQQNINKKQQKEMHENQDVVKVQSEKVEVDMRKEQDIRKRTNSLQYKRASKLSGKIF